MGILPKKSWHVYKEVNKEIVRHDEEQDQIQKELSNQRAEQAEREERLNLLRSLAKNNKKNNNNSNIKAPSQNNSNRNGNSTIEKNLITKDHNHNHDHRHFSLFNEDDLQVLERKTDTQKSIQDRTNQDEPFKFSLNPKINNNPWYASKTIDDDRLSFCSSLFSHSSFKRHAITSSSSFTSERDEQCKEREDPLNRFATFKRNRITNNDESSTLEQFERITDKRENKQKQGKEKEKTKDQLAHERMEREKREKIKTMKLLQNREMEKKRSSSSSIRENNHSHGYNHQYLSNDSSSM